PMPQMLKPYLEASFNYDSFRDRNIDTPSQERLPDGDRYTSRSSAGAVALGKALGYSPQRIEHLVRGYFGWLGTQALSAADWAARPALDMPANPSRDMAKIENWFVVGDFLKGADTTSSKYTQRFYDQQREIDQVYAAFTQARKEGDIERARELAGDDKLKLRGLYQSANRRMQEIGQQIKRIE
ncbi:LPD38 domain-containing protein, partial [Agrobacterium tumefaciens]|uniref:LPD38 domain-containing protein n=1 Tax=Agrobacterium tumefaciens TaxID=358 RepID=UPI003BA37F38